MEFDSKHNYILICDAKIEKWLDQLTIGSKIGPLTSCHHSVLYGDSYALVMLNVALSRVANTTSLGNVHNHMKV